MINSLTSLTFRLGFILTGPLIGQVAGIWGLTVALNAPAFRSIVMFALVMMPLIKAVIVLQMNDESAGNAARSTRI